MELLDLVDAGEIAHLVVREVSELDQLDAIVRLVADDAGIALVPETASDRRWPATGAERRANRCVSGVAASRYHLFRVTDGWRHSTINSTRWRLHAVGAGSKDFLLIP